MKIVLDANCFIDAVNPSSVVYQCLRQIFSAADDGRVRATISRHSLAELSEKPDAAYDLARTVEVVPNWPIGTIAEQVATIEQLTGTYEDAYRNEKTREKLKQLVKSGEDIRDQGPYLDALLAGAEAFVTSDRHLVGNGPRKRMQDEFGLRVLTPCELVSGVGL